MLVSLGFLTNLADLLLSPPDTISPLTGHQLVQTKVAAVYVMGGVYPHSGLLASFNFSCARYLILSPAECEGAARRAVDNMPSEVRLVFSGNHVGDNIWTGGCLSSRRQF